MNTVMVSFNTVVRQMTEMSEWRKCLSKIWPKCLSEKNRSITLYPVVQTAAYVNLYLAFKAMLFRPQRITGPPWFAGK